MKSRKIFAGPLLLGAFALAACGSGSSNDPATDSSDQPSIAPVTAQDINVQDRANLAQGGELRLAVSDLGTNWNPLQIDGNNNELTGIRNTFLPNFFNFDAKGAYTPNAPFVTSADVVSDDPTTINLKLNPKAVWGDGSAIDVDDIKATWEACNGKDKSFRCASTDGFDKIASVTSGADKFDVTVTFSQAYPDWASPLSLTLKAESVKDAKTFNDGWTELDNDWLAGPYKVDAEDKTQKTVSVVPNDKWWGDKPLLDKITWRTVATDATPNAFVNGEIDAFDIGPDPNGFQLASGVADGAVRKAAGPNWRHITFNSKAGVLKDEKVRQALVKGLDRAAIGASDLAGIDWPVTQLNNGIILSNQQGYVDLGQKTGIDYNVEQAKSDLEGLGWVAGSDGIREKDGKKLTVKFSALDGVPASQNEALQTQNQLKEIGVKVDIVNVPADEFNTTLSSHSFELIAFTWIGTPFPFANINQLYGTGSESNYQQVSLPETDKLITEISKETDPAARIDLANQVAEQLWTSVGIVPLYQRPELIATKAKLANYGAFGLSSPQWENIGFQK
ncbi:peptide/nickel transport system substrate-binding protein [Friedmanniella luteola]|uniref:Peptide/nickel transport system substrate-binding protein n=1 Tax=Friedmanniella luteola TaxID=546871 RepID=A0A1H1MW91_9ACTN|nr:ABC transporter family substrate-binding protein [Friedmanniella luteola]SDR91143.1 peptide/nickel transport system substrate-binding protein [Friedmanniella luteola]